jgi:hypothetical protein
VDTLRGESPALVSEAIVLWTGQDLFSYPHEDDARLVEQYGEDKALTLIPIVRALAHEFDQSDAAHTVEGLKEMGVAAEARFAALHPELTSEALHALGWRYVWRWK